MRRESPRPSSAFYPSRGDILETDEAEESARSQTITAPLRQPEAACWGGRRKPTRTAVMSDGRKMFGPCPTSGPTM